MGEIAGYCSAILIGLSLGMTGGGGSILTIPALVYLLGISPVLATAYSLFIVGATSLTGSLSYMIKGELHYKVALYFAVPSLLVIFLMRSVVVPGIPEAIFSFQGLVLTKDILIMVFFAITMIISSYYMIRAGRNLIASNEGTQDIDTLSLVLQGLGVGVITGFVGAGGGFLIIPALVLFAKLPMKQAIGTSLFIIGINSLLGFLGDVYHRAIDWQFLIIFTIIAVVGIFLGSAFTKSISGKDLKSIFGWFVLVMGIVILLEEIFSI